MDDICRTCLLPNDNLESLFEWKLVGNQILPFSKIISLCTGLEVSKFDDFSNFICALCSSALLQSFEYRRKCWDSHRILLKRNKIKRDKIKSIVNDQASEIPHTTENSDENYYVEVLEDYNMKVKQELNGFYKEVVKIESNRNSPILDQTKNDTILPTDTMEDRTTSDGYKIVLMRDFLRHVEYKIDKSKHFGRIFVCRTCSQAYENQHYMVNHFKAAHKTLFKLEKEFKCNICPKIYGDQIRYQRHLRWHNDRTCYVCTYCGVTLKCKFTLTEHIRVHTGEKPYKCNYCDFRSGKRSVTTVHMRTHTGERPFLCHICNIRLPTTAARSTHMKTHSTDFKYECTICNKKFRTPGVLSTHKLIHDPSKHKECSICGKQFSRLTQMKNHMRIHTNDYIHKCSECGKGFIQRHSWRNHMKNHHNQIVL